MIILSNKNEQFFAQEIIDPELTMRDKETEKLLREELDSDIDFMVFVEECRKQLSYDENDIEDLCYQYISEHDVSIILEPGFPQSKRILEKVAIRHYNYLDKLEVDDNIWLVAIEYNCDAYSLYPNPSEEFTMAAIELNPYILKHIKEPTRDMMIMALSIDGNLLEHVPMSMRDEELCFVAVKSQGTAIDQVPEKEMSEEMMMTAIKTTPKSIMYIPYPTMEMCMLALEKAPDFILCYVKNPPDGFIEEAVKRWYWNIKCVENPSEELCWLALQNNPWAINCLPNPSEEMLAYVGAKYPF